MPKKQYKTAYLVTLWTDQPIKSKDGAVTIRARLQEHEVINEQIQKVTVTPVAEK